MKASFQNLVLILSLASVVACGKGGGGGSPAAAASPGEARANLFKVSKKSQVNQNSIFGVWELVAKEGEKPNARVSFQPNFFVFAVKCEDKKGNVDYFEAFASARVDETEKTIEILEDKIVEPSKEGGNKGCLVPIHRDRNVYEIKDGALYILMGERRELRSKNKLSD